ncbi:MAG: S8 family serine peptidase [Pseudolabrys sp.]|nr:S8 family serine peptidase [Pseudolabrys sp.]
MRAIRTVILAIVLASLPAAFASDVSAQTNDDNPKYRKLKNGPQKAGTGSRRFAVTPAAPSLATTPRQGPSNAAAGGGGGNYPPNRGGYTGGGGRGPYGGGGNYNGGGGFRGPGWGGVLPGVVMGLPGALPPGGGYAPPGAYDPDDYDYRNNRLPNRQAARPPKQQRTAQRRPGSGVPPANEQRLVPDEVVIELPNTTSAQAVSALEQRHNLTRLQSQPMQLAGTTFYRWRIPDGRSVSTVVRALENDGTVSSAQPNYLFALQQQAEAKAEPVKADPADGAVGKPQSLGEKVQYGIAKMRLGEAHGVAKGNKVLIAVIDSAVDPDHPELAGAIAGSYDTLDTPLKPHAHGTAIAALIVAHAKLTGTAPGAQVLAIRAFDPAGSSGAEATTFSILRGLDWAVVNGARIINMSFAGPADPAIKRGLEAAKKKGLVLIAAAGNAGAKSPPLYPAADSNVIAVTATDADDNLFEGANRGKHIAVAAPGVNLMVAIPDGGYQVSTGTSYSAAGVSGIAALMLERNPRLTPEGVRAILMLTTKDLGPKGHDDQFGAGLTDAYRAVTQDPAAVRVTSAPGR